MKKRILGFTLIELLIVITIIGILAVVFIPTVMNAPAKARDAARQAAVTNIIKGIEAGRLDGVDLPSTTGGCINNALTAFQSYFPNGAFPSDPKEGNFGLGSCGDDAVAEGKYTYEYYSTDKKYGVFARVENGNGNIDCSEIGGGAITAPTIATLETNDCWGGISQ